MNEKLRKQIRCICEYNTDDNEELDFIENPSEGHIYLYGLFVGHEVCGGEHPENVIEEVIVNCKIDEETAKLMREAVKNF